MQLSLLGLRFGFTNFGSVLGLTVTEVTGIGFSALSLGFGGPGFKLLPGQGAAVGEREVVVVVVLVAVAVAVGVVVVAVAVAVVVVAVAVAVAVAVVVVVVAVAVVVVVVVVVVLQMLRSINMLKES